MVTIALNPTNPLLSVGPYATTLVTHMLVKPGLHVCMCVRVCVWGGGDQVFSLDMLNLRCLSTVPRKLSNR